MKINLHPWTALMLAVSAILGLARDAAAKDPKPETRIYTFPQCPATGPDVYAQRKFDGALQLLAPLISAVVTPLIEGVVDKGVTAIKDAAKDKEFPIDPPKPLMKSFYQVGLSGETGINEDLGCVVIVRGVFEDGSFFSTDVPASTPLAARIDAKFRVRVDSGKPQSLKDQYTRIKPGTLEFYFEVVPVLSDDHKTLGFRPQALSIERFASKDGFFGPDNRDYQFTLTFADPFGTQAFSSADFKYEGIKLPFNKEACVAVAATTYCPAAELGGIRGWYATKPISDDFAPMIKKRQANAVTLKMATTSWVAPSPIRPRVADDEQSVKDAQTTYCHQLELANQKKLAGSQQWDDRCPLELVLAKLNYQYAQTVAAAHFDKLAADRFWDKECRATNKTVLSKSDSNLVECLRILDQRPQQDRSLAGTFLITSTIIETRSGNKVAAFFAPVADKVAPTLKTDLEQKLDPVAKAKAALQAAADEKAKRDALHAVAVADDTAKSAQIAYDAALSAQASSPTPANQIATINAHIALINAQVAANDTYRAANLPIPFPLAP
ncbi:hypothetical protein [Chromobacterium subtsugae]|uniref:hypothetical protein n=1 Tax=Chromobacterium subtsugae TaxID=251747 RepID=UPI000640BF05|nr:hypothetical protein [Chromobacterium subtsugae]